MSIPEIQRSRVILPWMKAPAMIYCKQNRLNNDCHFSRNSPKFRIKWAIEKVGVMPCIYLVVSSTEREKTDHLNEERSLFLCCFHSSEFMAFKKRSRLTLCSQN